MGISGIDSNILPVNNISPTTNADTVVKPEESSPSSATITISHFELELKDVHFSRARHHRHAGRNNHQMEELGFVKGAMKGLKGMRKIMNRVRKMMRRANNDDIGFKDIMHLQKDAAKLNKFLDQMAEKTGFESSKILEQMPDTSQVITSAMDNFDSADPSVSPGTTITDIPMDTPIVDTDQVIPDTPSVSPGPVVVPETTIDPDAVITTDPDIVVDDVIPTGDVVIDPSDTTGDVLTDQTNPDVDNAIETIDDMLSQFGDASIRLESSMIYFSEPGFESITNILSYQDPYTSFELIMNSTRTEMMTDSGRSVTTQTFNLSFDMVSLLT